MAFWRRLPGALRRRLARLLHRGQAALELGFDYALVAGGPLTRRLPAGAAQRYLRFVHGLYARRRRDQRFEWDSHRTLAVFQRDYDAISWRFYDPFLGENWHRGRRVLDVGCFVGAKCARWAADGAALVVGIDLSARGIAAAQALPAADNLCFLHTSAEALAADPKWAGTFDVIVSYTVFEHIETHLLPGVLAACHALLRPGGRLAICYNHCDDRFGSHVFLFLAHPWPQRLVAAQHYQRFCDEALARAHARGEMGYFPAGYTFLGSGHGADCYMGLNRLTAPEFLALARASPFGDAVQAHAYSRAALARALWRNGRGPRLFHPSMLYVLTRTS